jgi:hypothetical protein
MGPAVGVKVGEGAGVLEGVGVGVLDGMAAVADGEDTRVGVSVGVGLSGVGVWKGAGVSAVTVSVTMLDAVGDIVLVRPGVAVVSAVTAGVV